MSLTYLGTMSVGACVPIVLAAQAQISIAIGNGLPALVARLQGLLRLALRFEVTPPVLDLQLRLKAALKLAADVQVAIAGGITPPGITLPNVGLLALIAQIQLAIDALNLGIDFVADLDAILGTPGVSAYTYSGRADAFGSAFSAAFAAGIPSGGGPATEANAIVLATTIPMAWASMQLAFRT